MKSMNFKYKLGIFAVGVIAASSCANHDLIPDMSQIGQPVPH